jgi:elongator complex protein 3
MFPADCVDTEEFYEEIISELLSGSAASRDEIQRLKTRLCKKYRMDELPSNADILAHVPEEDMDSLEPLLRKKPVRTISGVAVVAVMTPPFGCPHGKCSYCPGGVEKGTAQSYTGREPAALRAAQHGFDPYAQVQARLRQLERIGHPTDKVDLIIMGGTFTAREPSDQVEFVKRCFDAMNGSDSAGLPEAHSMNETAANRCVGLTVETRPDHFLRPQVDMALGLGATRVELGVQTLNDAALAAMKRGHGCEASAFSSQIARDAGMKIAYHMMPGLPGETPETDLATFKKLFSDERFRPDMLKIYPTLVIEGTGLYDIWKAGEYEPYTQETLVGLLADIKEILPKWVRVQRIQRDIPVQLIEGGSRQSHLRERAQEELEARGSKCSCIRCREAGHNYLKGRNTGELALLEEKYTASGGKEFFISFEDKEMDILAGFARLRLPSELAHRHEMAGSSVVRELRAVSQQLPFSVRDDKSLQHRGLGEALINRCLEISADNGKERMLVMSGVGAREYYRKLGFERIGPYMGRAL